MSPFKKKLSWAEWIARRRYRRSAEYQRTLYLQNQGTRYYNPASALSTSSRVNSSRTSPNSLVQRRHSLAINKNSTSRVVCAHNEIMSCRNYSNSHAFDIKAYYDYVANGHIVIDVRIGMDMSFEVYGRYEPTLVNGL